jgi:hypothetical protein
MQKYEQVDRYFEKSVFELRANGAKAKRKQLSSLERTFP